MLEDKTSMTYFINASNAILTSTRYQEVIVEEHNVGKPYDASWLSFVLSEGSLKHGIRTYKDYVVHIYNYMQLTHQKTEGMKMRTLKKIVH
jgi:hypothetical protein